jgi:hypothetical protein
MGIPKLTLPLKPEVDGGAGIQVTQDPEEDGSSTFRADTKTDFFTAVTESSD